MDIFQKLYEIENETGGDVSGIKKLIDSGQVTIASSMPSPDPKESVREISLINSFVQRNPRDLKADGGRIYLDRGGVAQVREFVENLPKNTVITRQLIQDFVDKNDVNVNVPNLFATAKKSYLGNMIKDKSITIDGSYPTGLKKYKKSKAILEDPKKLKEFLKYAKGKKVTGKMIREKYKLSNEEFFYGGLRDLIDKDFQQYARDAASNIKNKTVENIKTLLNDSEASRFLKKGDLVPDEILARLNIDSSAAATATTRIGQIYGGNDFGIDEFKKIRKNVKASNKLFETMNKFGFGNPYRSKLYNISLQLIDEQLGNEKGTFKSLKDKARYILRKNKITGFSINEIAGVTGTARTGVGEFSQFIDIMQSNLNEKEMASFQAAFSKARQNIKNDPSSFKTESRKINKLAGIFEREYGVKLPRIRAVDDVEKYYSPNRLKELADQGLDIKTASQKLGYTIQMPPGSVTIQEFVNQTPQAKKQLENLLLKLSAQIDPDCKQAVATGGRVGLKTVGSPEVCISKAKNYMNQELVNGIGTQQNAKTSLIKRILTGAAGFVKQNLSPKELLKMENLIGKPALYGAALFETGLVADDVLRKGKRLNVAAAESLFGTVLNLDADAAKAKNLLESNTQLSPAAKEYAQNIIDYDRYRKNTLSFPSSLIAKSMPGSDKYFKMQEDLKNKIVSTPDTGALDYQSALTESEAIFKAKPKEFLGLEVDSPDAPEVTPLTNKFAKPPGTRVGPMTTKQDMKIDLTPLTYDNFQPNIPPKEDFDNYLRGIDMIGQDQELTEEEYQKSFYKPEEFKQLMEIPGFKGAQDKFATGGRAGYNNGKLVEPVEIDFASAEDRAFSDMMKAFRYYIKSGGKKSLKEYMRMSTGAGRKGGGKEHFRGAGGGIAKLAGVDDGPPPKSGPNPQGLSYLMKRGKNT